MKVGLTFNINERIEAKLRSSYRPATLNKKPFCPSLSAHAHVYWGTLQANIFRALGSHSVEIFSQLLTRKDDHTYVIKN